MIIHDNILYNRTYNLVEGQYNLVDNQYKQKPELLYTFTIIKSYAYFLNLEATNLALLKT